MIFIESPIFTEDVRQLLSDEEYAALQEHLVSHPDAGDVIKDTGGLRKVRWVARGRGKRGGTRIIYLPLGSSCTDPHDPDLSQRN